MRWDALAARARGLQTRLLPAEQLDELTGARDLADVVRRLAAAGYRLPAGPISVRAIERAVRQRTASDLRILTRWAGATGGRLDPLLLDQDRRSLRALLRGIAGGAALEDRTASLVPTPELPAARLAELARQPSAAAVAELLVKWRSPLGWAIGPEASRSRPDLFTLERTIDRCFAARARDSARDSGRAVEVWLAHLLDHENAFSALALARGSASVDPDRMFVEGGERLPRAAFLAAVRAGPEGAGPLLARVFRSTALGAALGAGGDLEGAALEDRIAEQRDIARAQPASPAPVLLALLRRRAEERAIRRALWSVTLGTEVAA